MRRNYRHNYAQIIIIIPRNYSGIILSICLRVYIVPLKYPLHPTIPLGTTYCVVFLNAVSS